MPRHTPSYARTEALRPDPYNESLSEKQREPAEVTQARRALELKPLSPKDVSDARSRAGKEGMRMQEEDRQTRSGEIPLPPTKELHRASFRAQSHLPNTRSAREAANRLRDDAFHHDGLSSQVNVQRFTAKHLAGEVRAYLEKYPEADAVLQAELSKAQRLLGEAQAAEEWNEKRSLPLYEAANEALEQLWDTLRAGLSPAEQRWGPDNSDQVTAA